MALRLESDRRVVTVKMSRAEQDSILRELAYGALCKMVSCGRVIEVVDFEESGALVWRGTVFVGGSWWEQSYQIRLLNGTWICERSIDA